MIRLARGIVFSDSTPSSFKLFHLTYIVLLHDINQSPVSQAVHFSVFEVNFSATII